MINLNHMLFYYIIDLNEFDNIKNKAVTTRNNEIILPWKKLIYSPNELTYKLKTSNNTDTDNWIFQSFALDPNYYRHYLIDYKNIYLEPKNNLDDVEFKIKAIKIHMFKSGVCFLDLEYSILSNNQKDLINFNYFLSEVKSKIMLKIVRHKWNQITSAKEEEVETISINDFLKRILIDFDSLSDLDYKNDLKYFSVKPILFSYLFFDKDENVNSENMNYNFKSSYKINDESINKSQFFDNSIWYYSSTSVSNISSYVDDHITNQFFKTTFIDKFNSLYFMLFLISLHQKIMLILYVDKIKLINYSSNTFDELRDLCDEISIYKSNASEAKIKYLFRNPSTLDHVNLYYNLIQEKFNISDLILDLDTNLDELNSFLNNKLNLLQNYSSLKKEKKSIRNDIIIILITSILSFASLYDVFLKMIDNFKLNLNLFFHILFAVILFVICLVIPTLLNIKSNAIKLTANYKAASRLEKLIEKNNKSV